MLQYAQLRAIGTIPSNLTFPANGMRKGSVQYIPRRASAIRDVLTAIDNSMGSSGGITEVIISEQLRKSLYLLLVGSSSPYSNDRKSQRYTSFKQSKNINGLPSLEHNQQLLQQR